MNLTTIEGKVAVVLAVIVALDNALAAIPAIQANSTFQLISGILIKIKNVVSPSS